MTGSTGEKLKDTAAPHADAQPIVHTLYAAGFHAIQPSVLTKEDDVKIIQCKDERPSERSAGRVGSWTREQLGLGQVPSCAAARRRARQNATSSAEQHASVRAALWHWRDWLFVGSPEAMAPLARMADRFVLHGECDALLWRPRGADTTPFASAGRAVCTYWC